MSFVASKVFWLVAKPSNLIVVLLVAGVALLWLGRRRSAAWLVTLSTASLVTVALLPVGSWLLMPLEDRFPPPEEPLEAVDGVIVLGGAVDPTVSAARDQPTLNDHAERMTALVELARRYPDARLVFTGGSASLFETPTTEADVARAFYRRQGVDVGRILFEDRSRSTFENVLLSKELADPKPGERWLLVTSAYHLPRSVGVFREAGWPVIAYPVDYRTTGRFELDARLGPGAGSGLDELDQALREWAGLAVYRLLGRTDALFPAPDPTAGVPG